MNYQPNQSIVDYNDWDLATSSVITGDFTTDSLKYGFGPTSLSAEDWLPEGNWVDLGYDNAPTEDQLRSQIEAGEHNDAYGDLGCPDCGNVDLFWKTHSSKGQRYRCLSCEYSSNWETVKSQGDLTLQKFGLTVDCPLCSETISAYNRASIDSHFRKHKKEEAEAAEAAEASEPKVSESEWQEEVEWNDKPKKKTEPEWEDVEWEAEAPEQPRKCCECSTTEGLTTIQAGTFCWDCLPINLGAESSQEIKEYITSIHDGDFLWRDGWDNLEFTLQTLPMEIFEEYKDTDNVDGAWEDSPVNSHRLEDTLSQFRWEGDRYPPVVLKLDKNGYYDIIDGYHRLNALQILDYDTVEAWVGIPASTFEAEEMFYYHGTDMTNLASILKEGIRPTADTDSRWGEDIMDISPYPYYYAEIDDILPSVFVADSVEEARWWADESGIEKIGVLKISSQVENLENFHGDGNGYKTSETIPKEYIVEVIGKTFAAEEFNSEQDAPLAGQTTEAPYEIKVYVPSTTLDQPISESDFKSRIDETQEKLSELFGGFTTVDASGGYLSQQDGVISEPVIVVSSWATVGDYQSKMGDLERFLKQKKDDWGQEVIGFEFENDFFMYPAFRAEEINLGAEDDIKLFYEGIYDNDGGFGDGNEMKSYSVVSKKDYRNYYEDTKWNPCECDVQGCLSCFLNEYPHQPQFTEGRIVSYGSLWFEDSVWDAETYEEATGVEFSEQNPKKIEADAPQDWRESIITIPQSDSFGNALYRKMSDLTYNQVWRVLEIIDDLNRMSHHHALTKFSSNYVEIWIYSHDSGLVMPKDYHWAEDFNDMIATVDWQMWESETEWDDIDWDNSTPSDWGDDISWQDDWGSLRPETRPEFPTVDAKIASMLRNHSKVNVNGEQGCPGCGQEDLFYRESTGTGTKWYCYGCFYTEKTESQKSKKVITLEKYGLKVRCPDCNEMIVAYNQASVNSHRKKCGVTK